MEVNAILCNYAQVENNQLFIGGGGVDRALIPAGSPGPYAANVAVGITIRVPWQQTNQQHTLELVVEDADGNPVEVPVGPDTERPVDVKAQFNIGRPPSLVTGEEQTVSLAINLPGLPLKSLGRYSFVISIDGTELDRLPYTLLTQPGLTFPAAG